jgi:hypothetical protein
MLWQNAKYILNTGSFTSLETLKFFKNAILSKDEFNTYVVTSTK